ncbi:MAG: addiction module toxin RelE [Bacteroidales bacterium]|nr:addiction module toxin RelE [Bacteroidales bacterium]
MSVFETQAKRLVKKYPSLKEELITLINALKENPKQGVSLKHNCYKIRLSFRSKGTGKSGGARIITHVVYKKTSVYLLNIYDKSHKNSITDKELKELINELPE